MKCIIRKMTVLLLVLILILLSAIPAAAKGKTKNDKEGRSSGVKEGIVQTEEDDDYDEDGEYDEYKDEEKEDIRDIEDQIKAGRGRRSDNPIYIYSSEDWDFFLTLYRRRMNGKANCLALGSDIGTGEPGDPVIARGFEEFSGSFDGNGKTITVQLNDPLFLECTNARISNINVCGEVNGSAAICGMARENTVFTNCVNNANVTGHSRVGGISGTAFADIKNPVCFYNCLNTGTIKGSSAVDGICGYSLSDTVFVNCVCGGTIITENPDEYRGGKASEFREYSYYRTDSDWVSYSRKKQSTVSAGDLCSNLNYSITSRNKAGEWYSWSLDDAGNPMLNPDASISITGSVISDGNVAIIVAVAVIAIGITSMILIRKKNKPVLAEGAEKECKDEVSVKQSAS